MLVKGATGVYVLLVQSGWYRKARQSCLVIYTCVTEQGHHWFKQRLVNYAAPITTLNIADSLSSERIRRTSIRNTHILFHEMHLKCRLHRTDHFVPASMSLCEEPNPVPDNRRLRLSAICLYGICRPGTGTVLPAWHQITRPQFIWA